jgi:hypothetical protein
MATDDLVRADDAGAFDCGERSIGAEAIRALVQARCPEIPLADLEAAFSAGRTDDVLSEIADAVTEAIEVLEARLERLEQGFDGQLQ